MSVMLYDTTLRDGAQGEGISFSVEDKLKITKILDEIGIHYIEGGWPGSNPKDREYFRRLANIRLRKSKVAAFSYTGHVGINPENDLNLNSLLDINTDLVTIVGKSWDFHVYKVLQTTLEENLRIIQKTVSFLRSKRLHVFYDGEQFFDGFKANPSYALKTLEVAADAGAEVISLCDTNGGSMPWEIEEIIRQVQKVIKIPLGIHAHNDCETGMINTLAAVRSGAILVQGTINGYGERVGNANLSSIIPNLKLKMGINCITDAQLKRLSEVSRLVSELANMPHNSHAPYVGQSAFAHKAGLHADATKKYRDLYQHIDPERVGNRTRILVSDLSGKANIMLKAEEIGTAHNLSLEEARKIVQRIKVLESKGFNFENADASVYLLIRRELNAYVPPFETIDFKVNCDHPANGTMLTEARVKLKVNGQASDTIVTEKGPLEALNAAICIALTPIYPILKEVELVGCKIHIVEGTIDNTTMTRVFISRRRGAFMWTTVGCSNNIIEAIWMALVDSLEYFLAKELDTYAK